MFFRHWDEPRKSIVLNVGDNQEDSANILTDNGWLVLGVDLREPEGCHPPRHARWKGEFVQMANEGLFPSFDCIYSLSALEHFGLKCYEGCPGDENLDMAASAFMLDLLRTGGTCYVTVPYGREYIDKGDWRVYNRESLQERIIGDFEVETRLYFKSGGCNVPDVGGIVDEQFADWYANGASHPHVTVFLKMRKT
jgi:hypothetical protein